MCKMGPSAVSAQLCPRETLAHHDAHHDAGADIASTRREVGPFYIAGIYPSARRGAAPPRPSRLRVRSSPPPFLRLRGNTARPRTDAMSAVTQKWSETVDPEVRPSAPRARAARCTRPHVCMRPVPGVAPPSRQRTSITLVSVSASHALVRRTRRRGSRRIARSTQWEARAPTGSIDR